MGSSPSKTTENIFYVRADDTQRPLTPHKVASMTPDDVLQSLEDGNNRFILNKMRAPRHDPVSRVKGVQGQHPIVTVVTCSDSRVPVEILFDQGIGDIFVIRNAGNVSDDGCAGSVQYAVEHLHTPIVMVLGHTCCGAVTATLNTAKAGAELPEGPISTLLSLVMPSVHAQQEKHGDGTTVTHCVEENAQRQVELLRERLSCLREAESTRKCRAVAAVYELETGKVRIIK